MTRMKKIDKAKYEQATRQMSADEIQLYDKYLVLKNRFEKIVRELQTELFPEESDWIYDTSLDKYQREIGINPMKEEYIVKVNEKRAKWGLKPLTDNGICIDMNESYELCKKLLCGEIDWR